ncbi:MAG: hypothetical protein ACOYOZ_15840, partial [Pirellula sp.]|jgi:hypothetical protein|nr:hypothetical protein [Pirellula sp.]
MSDGDFESADDLAREQPLLRGSVCLSCRDHRTIVSGRGSVFLLCQSAHTPPQWPKYPRQPLHSCPYWSESTSVCPEDPDPNATPTEGPMESR